MYSGPNICVIRDSDERVLERGGSLYSKNLRVDTQSDVLHDHLEMLVKGVGR